jgi:hypothetical protein
MLEFSVKKIEVSLLGLFVCQSLAIAQASIDRGYVATLGNPIFASEAEPIKPRQAELGAPEAYPGPPPIPAANPAPVNPFAVHGGNTGYRAGFSFNPTLSDRGPPSLAVSPTNSTQTDRSCLFWSSAEIMAWRVPGSNLPPLVTTSPAGTPLANAGVLGTPGAMVLAGDDHVNGELRAGGRFTFGAWFDAGHTWGIEADVMLVREHSSQFSAGSDGSQIFARPFVNAASGAENSEIVSYPGLLSGNVTVHSMSDPLIVSDVALRHALLANRAGHVDFLIGYRYLHFAEGLQIQENLTSLDPLTLGTNLRVSDHFATRNDFNGGLFGLDTEWTCGPLSLQIFGKVGLGNLRRDVVINGNTVITSPGTASMAYPGGLLALPSNSGTFTSDHFVPLPELGLTGGWQITRNLRATLGYSVLWLSDMVRPGDQIDRTVNSNQLPPPLPVSGPTRPNLTLRESDFWVQGLRIGLEFRY